MGNNFLLLDGAMGTMIQRKGIAVGQRPEILNLLEPEKITEIHQEYIDAGSDIFCTNTFGANRLKLEGTGHGVEEIVQAACQNAKRARDARHQLGRTITIACNIGPLGEMMEPNGTLTFETAYSCFEDLVLAARDQVDMFIIETMTDLFEMKAAILAINEHSDLPIFASMSYEEDGRTFTGVAPANFATLASRLGVDALGANCSVGPEKMFYIIREMAEVTNTPILVKANAGLPDPETGKYNLDAPTFAHKMLPIADLGVKYIGGCCGTGPEYIAEIKKALQGRTSHRDPVPLRPHLSSSTATYHLFEVYRKLLQGRKVVVRTWHIHAFQIYSVTDVVNIEVGHVFSEVRKFYALCRCAFHNFFGEGVRLRPSFDTPPAAIGSVFRHVDHFHFCGAGFNTLFE